MTRDEWIAAGAARYVEIAQIDAEAAQKIGRCLLDAAIEFEGSEAAAMECDPVEYADEDMACWGEG